MLNLFQHDDRFTIDSFTQSIVLISRFQTERLIFCYSIHGHTRGY